MSSGFSFPLITLSLEILSPVYWFTFLVTFTNLLLHLFGARGEGICHRSHVEVKGRAADGSFLSLCESRGLSSGRQQAPGLDLIPSDCKNLPQRIRWKNCVSLVLLCMHSYAYTHLHRHIHMYANHIHIREKGKSVSKTDRQVGKDVRERHSQGTAAQSNHHPTLGRTTEHVLRKERSMFNCLFCVRTCSYMCKFTCVWVPEVKLEPGTMYLAF